MPNVKPMLFIFCIHNDKYTDIYIYNIYIYIHIYTYIYIHIHRQAHSVQSHDAMVKTWVNNSATGELSSIHGDGVISFYSGYIFIYTYPIYTQYNNGMVLCGYGVL